MTKQQQLIAWSTLLLGLLVLIASGYAAYSIGVRLALEMQPLRWWQAVIAFSPVQFIPRCLAVDADCRSVFGSAFLERYGVGQYVFIFALMLSIAGVVLVIPKPSKPYAARFATLGDVNSLLLTPKDSFAIPLLSFRGKTLGIKHDPKRGEALKHILLTAPSQTGKSVHAKSVLGTFKGSTILVDIKGELFRDTSGYRQELGRTFVLHPRGYGYQYDPFVDIGHDSASLKSAAELLITDPRDGDPIFAQRAVPAIAAALKAARLERQAAIPYLYDIISPRDPFSSAVNSRASAMKTSGRTSSSTSAHDLKSSIWSPSMTRVASLPVRGAPCSRGSSRSSHRASVSLWVARIFEQRTSQQK